MYTLNGTHLFLDCDGVLADFDIHCKNLFGFHPREVNDPTLWKNINSHEPFWTTIPVHEGAQALLDFALPFKPTIVTGCPKVGFDFCAEQKRIWIQKHIGDIEVITCLSKDKQKFMKNKGDILVDDFMSNILRWEEAGGRTVFYTQPEEGLAALKKLMEA